MSNGSARYDELLVELRESGHDLGAIETAIGGLQVETPSWGFGDSGTRFATFPQPGRPRNVFERIDDAAQVNALTGAAGAVALHFPWDAVDDLDVLRAHLDGHGLTVGAVNPNLFQDPDYKTGSVTNPSERVRAKAVAHLLDCVAIGSSLGATAQSLWFADGTSYAGQDDLAGRRGRLRESLEQLYAALPADQSLLLEYKPFEPAFYATDIADWGSALLLCQQLGERARVLVDLGHHLHGTNVEQIVSILAAEDRLGGFHFNARKYADDDLIVGSVNPLELFVVFCELIGSGKPLPRLTIDQAHNVEAKLEAMIVSVLNIQHAYAKALLVDRAALAAAQADGDVLAGHRILMSAFETDVRPLCAKVRADKGAAADPIAALRASGYLEEKISERSGDGAVTAGWGL
jgi:L-rhamnose isomerase / sugar isomerase